MCIKKDLHSYSEEVENHDSCPCIRKDDGEKTFSQARRRTHRGHLSSLRAVQTFQSFLTGTTGETFWHLWLDIEKARTIRDDTELAKYLYAESFRFTLLNPVSVTSPLVFVLIFFFDLAVGLISMQMTQLHVSRHK